MKKPYFGTYKYTRMQSKLTVTVDQEVILSAKEYARENSRSLSNIIEEYLKSLVSKKQAKANVKYSKLIQELKGSVQFSSKNIDYDILLEDALIKKHFK